MFLSLPQVHCQTAAFSSAPCDSARWSSRLENNAFRCFSDKDSELSDRQPISLQKSKFARIGMKKQNKVDLENHF